MTSEPDIDGGGSHPRPTEEPNPASRGIDRKGAREIVEIIHREDLRAWEAVGGALDEVGKLVDLVANAFREGRRLIYVGAGTSGRLGVLDASECPPTFGVDPFLVHGIIAGGDEAIRRAVEGAEDLEEGGAAAVREARARGGDVVCGIAASGSTPFVLGALEEAMRRDATTALISCNPIPPESRARRLVDVLIELVVGPEIIAGSTRMKAGTATKMVLNMITTAAMIRWGKVYDNLMVDMRPTNRKLVRRGVGLIARIGGVAPERAAELLRLSGGDVKRAIVMGRRRVAEDEARRLLEESGGMLRPLIERAPDPPGGPPAKGA
jgi:N-acetylmuramic acid 6-phosphate etherase